jgi:hypothetical protein
LKLPKFKRLKFIIVIAALLIIAAVSTYVYAGYVRVPDYASLKKSFSFEEGGEFKPLSAASGKAPDMVLAASNDRLELYINETTTEIAVCDKESGELFYSNPADRQNDTLANPVNKDMLSSQLIVKYFDTNRNENTMTNNADSIERGQFKIQSITNGVRITYTLGELSSESDNLPKFITAERLQEKILGKLDAKTAKYVGKQFVVSSGKAGFLELKNNAVNSKIILGQLLKAFETAGYTKEDLAYENSMSGGGTQEAEKPGFVIPLDYVLKEDQLVVTVATDHIEEKPAGKLSTIEVLRYFGAAGVKDQGYMFVPSGSGSLISFNNGKTTSEPYVQQVYALDPLIISYRQTQRMEPARLPVFGMKKNNNAWFAMIQDGDAIASIQADISGKLNSYNYVFSYFNLRDNEQLSMFGATGSEADLPVVDNKMYSGNITIKYTFLNKENANYSGMARYYQNQLVKGGILTRLDDSRDMPFYLDILGGFEKRALFVGIPYKTTYAMTTFEEAGKIVDALREQGIKNIRLRYMGWFNDGYYHDIAKSVHVIGKLGGKSGLRKLGAKLEESGGRLFPDVAFQKVSYTSNSFLPTFEASRYISGISVCLSPYNPATMRMWTRFDDAVYYIQSPAVLPKVVDGFAASYTKLGLKGLSLRDLGDILASDKRRKRPIDREFAKDIGTGQLDKLDKAAEGMMIEGGNSYALAYASDLTCMPDSSNQFFIADEEVPFYEIVVHGFIDYTGGPFNLNSAYNHEEEVLKMLEYGVAPHYSWTYEETSKLKNTSMEYMFSTHYTDWMDDAVKIYGENVQIQSKLRTQKMTEHIRHKEGVYEMKYQNGASVYVNYTNTPFNTSGITVKARSYAVKGVM